MLHARKKIQKKELKKDPFFEKIDQGVRFYKGHKNLLYGVAVVIVLAIGLFYIVSERNAAGEIKAAGTFGIAQQYLDQGDFDSAENRLNEILSSNAAKEYKGLATYYMGYIAMNRSEYEKARGLFENYLKDYSTQKLYNESALVGIARIEEGFENYDKAGDYFEKAGSVSESYRKEFDHFKNAVECYLRNDDVNSAKTVYDKLKKNKVIEKEFKDELKTLSVLINNE